MTTFTLQNIISITFVFSLLAFPGIDAKHINLSVDSEDVEKLFKSLINSDVVKMFANHVFQRSRGTDKGYSNPYHPEDELTSFFDEVFPRDINSYNMKRISNTEKKFSFAKRVEEENKSIDDGSINDNEISGFIDLTKAAPLINKVNPDIVISSFNSNNNVKTDQNDANLNIDNESKPTSQKRFLKKSKNNGDGWDTKIL